MILIFDLDGTVLDTFKLIRASFIHTFEKHLPEHQYTEEELASYFGPVLDETFGNLVSDAEKVEEMINTYRKFNLSNHDRFVSAFPDSRKILSQLKEEGYTIAILSNKRSDAILLGLEVVGFLDFFDLIVGSDDVKNVKPDPEGIYKILAHFNSDKAIMIGDTAYDMQAAKNADIISIGVTWALTSSEELQINGADYVAHSYQDIYKYIKEVQNNV